MPESAARSPFANLPPAIEVFRSRKMAALLLLGFASGLPYLITQDLIKAWLTLGGVDLTTLGVMGLVSLPYSLKFAWSPLMDRFALPPGRRRGWILLTQALLALCIGSLAAQDPTGRLWPIAALAVAIAWLSASQDIAFDAWRVEVLGERERGAGAALGVLGYRVAMLFTGAFGLWFAVQAGWAPMWLGLGLTMLLTCGVTLLAPEGSTAEAAPTSLVGAVYQPFVDFFQRFGASRALMLLAFVLLYKLGDAWVGSMAMPFLIRTGFDPGEIGAIKSGVGLFATIAGTLTGGALLGQVGTNRSLWAFGILQALSNLVYVLLASAPAGRGLLVTAIVVEGFCGGLGTAAFVAFLMGLCNPRFAATQYALLSSFMALGRDLLTAPTGLFADLLGWPGYFMLTLVLAGPGLALLPFFAPWSEDTPA